MLSIKVITTGRGSYVYRASFLDARSKGYGLTMREAVDELYRRYTATIYPGRVREPLRARLGV